MTDIMIDLETMSTAPDAAIVSIGAVEMRADGFGETFYRVVDLESSRAYGGRIDSETILWWMRQGTEAKAAFASEEKLQRSHVCSMLSDLHAWCNRLGPIEERLLWSNGADFDLPILASAKIRLGQDPLWHHWNSRCFRTLKNLHREVKAPERIGTDHNALSDAINQARHWHAIMYQRVTLAGQEGGAV